MDDILFRAQPVGGGEWINGFYFCMHHDDERKHLHHFLIPNNCPIPKEKPIGEIQIEVDPDTVCQFTGATDIDGVYIFDGDVIDIEDVDGNHKIGAVTCIENGWRVFTKEDYLRDLYSYVPSADEVRVVGNRFDHPVLWEKAFRGIER